MTPDHLCPRCSCAVLIPGGEVVSWSVRGKRRRRGDAVRCARCTHLFCVGDFGIIEPRRPEAEAPPPGAVPPATPRQPHMMDRDQAGMWDGKRR